MAEIKYAKKLIEASALINDIQGSVSEVCLNAPYDEEWFTRLHNRMREIIAIIERQPSVEPERPKGRWIPTGMSNSTGPIVRCSACGQYINPSETAIDLNRQKLEPSFCEGCGADMRGESE